jgi:hypothetical protein
MLGRGKLKRRRRRWGKAEGGSRNEVPSGLKAMPRNLEPHPRQLEGREGRGHG